MNVIPHVAQNTSQHRSALPDAISVQKRKLIELCFGWAKTVGRTRMLTLCKIRLQVA
jgi:hypothetical protein